MATVSVTFREFPARQALAEALAEKVAATLAAAISTRGRALIAVSGGTTPELFFRQLSQASLDWSRVTVTLVDERFVEPSSERSNEGLIRRTLLQGPAAAARFVALYRTAPDAPDAFREAAEELAGLDWPLDIAVLGMGGDGHTASFFPDAPNLGDLLDPANDCDLEYVTAPSAVETRFTLSLARLAAARFIALHIEGEAKRKVLASVLEGEKLPVRAVLEHARAPIEVFWAP